MIIINKIISFIVSILDLILPTFDLSADFLAHVDFAIVTIINLLESANYFLPLDIFVVCFSVMLIVDNFALLTRIGQFIIKLVRG